MTQAQIEFLFGLVRSGDRGIEELYDAFPHVRWGQLHNAWMEDERTVRDSQPPGNGFITMHMVNSVFRDVVEPGVIQTINQPNPLYTYLRGNR